MNTLNKISILFLFLTAFTLSSCNNSKSEEAKEEFKEAIDATKDYITSERDELKEDFDIRSFHDMIHSNGSVTLSVLEKLTERFIKEQKAKRKKA